MSVLLVVSLVGLLHDTCADQIGQAHYVLRVTRDDSQRFAGLGIYLLFGSPMSANVAPNPASSVMRSTGEFMSRMIVSMLTLHASRSISSVARRRITVCRICQARLRSFNVPLPV